MAERLMGVETEYAVTGMAIYGNAVEMQYVTEEILRQAKERFSYLPDAGAGLYLGNGARFYVDYGLHPEMSTPECDNPTDAVRYVLAGEQMLAGISKEIESKTEISRAMIFKCNVDYSGEAATWGCHESYLHKAEPSSLSDQVIPHLVSRVIMTGAGGFDSLSSGLEFTLSPRVHHIVKEVSDDSTYDRGIFHTKDEPLSKRGYHRLHIICGESLSSHTAMWLRLATTALVVAMAEAGLEPGNDVQLVSPLQAMRAFATDTSCTSLAMATGKRRLSAVEIQYHYLALAERHLKADFMPRWAEAACHHWRAMLNRLLDAPESVETTLDWAIKLALYKEHARSRGFSWDSITNWTHIIKSLRHSLNQREYYYEPITIDLVLGANSSIADVVCDLEPLMRRKNMTWDELRPFLDLRKELFEIDVKFGQLGDAGIFSALDRAGALAHRFPGVENIEQAITDPPAGGRAQLRGQTIRKLQGERSLCRCDWQGVWDGRSRLVLDLSDPFETEERWHDIEKLKSFPSGLETLQDFLVSVRLQEIGVCSV